MEAKVVVRLSDKEADFCTKLALGLPPTTAATQAGWSASSARNLLGKPAVAAVVRQMNKNLIRVVQKMDAEASA